MPSSEINGHSGETRIDINQETTYSSSQEDLVKKANHDSILKRIPIGAEATTVLVSQPPPQLNPKQGQAD